MNTPNIDNDIIQYDNSTCLKFVSIHCWSSGWMIWFFIHFHHHRLILANHHNHSWNITLLFLSQYENHITSMILYYLISKWYHRFAWEILSFLSCYSIIRKWLFQSISLILSISTYLSHNHVHNFNNQSITCFYPPITITIDHFDCNYDNQIWLSHHQLLNTSP